MIAPDAADPSTLLRNYAEAYGREACGYATSPYYGSPWYAGPIEVIAIHAAQRARVAWRFALAAVDLDAVPTLAALLRRARPDHDDATCPHCGMDELPRATCGLVRLLDQIDHALGPEVQ